MGQSFHTDVKSKDKHPIQEYQIRLGYMLMLKIPVLKSSQSTHRHMLTHVSRSRYNLISLLHTNEFGIILKTVK